MTILTSEPSIGFLSISPDLWLETLFFKHKNNKRTFRRVTDKNTSAKLSLDNVTFLVLPSFEILSSSFQELRHSIRQIQSLLTATWWGALISDRQSSGCFKKTNNNDMTVGHNCVLLYEAWGVIHKWRHEVLDLFSILPPTVTSF